MTPIRPGPTACAAGRTGSPRCSRAQSADFGYANLAIRGRKLPAILDEQVEPALALAPDLVTIHGGGNDVLRPKVDLDALAATYDDGGRPAGRHRRPGRGVHGRRPGLHR